MRHDDSVPINAAISSICSRTATGGTVGGIVEFPATSAYPLGQSISLYGCWGVTLSVRAQTGDGGHPVELEWHGGTGGTVINMNKAADSRTRGAVGLRNQREHGRRDYRRGQLHDRRQRG